MAHLIELKLAFSGQILTLSNDILLVSDALKSFWQCHVAFQKFLALRNYFLWMGLWRFQRLMALSNYILVVSDALIGFCYCHVTWPFWHFLMTFYRSRVCHRKDGQKSNLSKNTLYNQK